MIICYPFIFTWLSNLSCWMRPFIILGVSYHIYRLCGKVYANSADLSDQGLLYMYLHVYFYGTRDTNGLLLYCAYTVSCHNTHISLESCVLSPGTSLYNFIKLVCTNVSFYGSQVRCLLLSVLSDETLNLASVSLTHWLRLFGTFSYTDRDSTV